MGSNVKICLSCGLVANATAEFCSACGQALTQFGTANDSTHRFERLVESDSSANWASLYNTLNSPIAGKLRLLKSALVPKPIAEAGIIQGLIVGEIEDDPWSVSIQLPNGEASAPWAACYFRHISPQEEFEGQLFSLSEEAFLGIAENSKVVSYALIPCPRCEWIFNQTEVAIEGEEEFDRDLADPECIACGGSGEWVLGE